jgi:hypothetical protein
MDSPVNRILLASDRAKADGVELALAAESYAVVAL